MNLVQQVEKIKSEFNAKHFKKSHKTIEYLSTEQKFIELQFWIAATEEREKMESLRRD